MQWDESCAWEWSRKAWHFEKSLPRYAGYSGFPPTLLSNEENNWTSPSSHCGAVTAPTSLPATQDLGHEYYQKNSRIQRVITALRGPGSKGGRAHPEITPSLPQVAPALTHPPTWPHLREKTDFLRTCSVTSTTHATRILQFICGHMGTTFRKTSGAERW